VAAKLPMCFYFTSQLASGRVTVRGTIT